MNIANNQSVEQAVPELVKMIEKNQNLKKLVMSNCKISFNACSQVLVAIFENQVKFKEKGIS